MRSTLPDLPINMIESSFVQQSEMASYKCKLLVSFSITVTEGSNSKYYRECDWSILTAEGCDWPVAGT